MRYVTAVLAICCLGLLPLVNLGAFYDRPPVDLTWIVAGLYILGSLLAGALVVGAVQRSARSSRDAVLNGCLWLLCLGSVITVGALLTLSFQLGTVSPAPIEAVISCLVVALGLLSIGAVVSFPIFAPSWETGSGSRAAIPVVVGAVLLVVFGYGANWLATRTVAADDVVNVRVPRSALLELVKKDMVGTLNRMDIVTSVKLPSLAQPRRLLLIDLNPERLAQHGLNRADVVAAVTKAALTAKGRDGTPTVAHRDNRISVGQRGYGSLSPASFRAVQALKLEGKSGAIGIGNIASVQTAVAPGVTRRRDREFPKVTIRLKGRWHYPAAMDAVERYLEDNGVNPSKRNSAGYAFVDRNERRINR